MGIKMKSAYSVVGNVQTVLLVGTNLFDRNYDRNYDRLRPQLQSFKD